MSIKASVKITKPNIERNLKNLLSGNNTLEAGFFKESKYPNGEQVAEVAFWQEYGTIKIPPRPFFRQVTYKKQKAWQSLFFNLIKQNQNVNLSLNKVGEIMRGDIVESITTLKEPPNALSTIAQKGSSNPLIDTSFMRSNVTFKVVNK